MTKQFISSVIALTLFTGIPALASEIIIPVSSSGQSVVPTLPALPTISDTQPGDNQITVTWQTAPGAEGYRVYRIKDGGASELIAELDAGELSHTDSPLDDGNYSYQVQPFLGSLSQNLDKVFPTAPETISTPTPASTPAPTSGGSGGGGGGSGGPTTSTPPPTTLSAAAQKVDVNKDNKVDVLDFNTLMVNWGSNAADNIADFDGNGVVNIFDFNLLMVSWTG